MIHEVRNIELCELLDTEPKTQCKVCLSYWDIGIVHCTCGHFLRKGTEENKKFIQYTMGLLSILDYFKERATSRAPLREEARRQRILTSPISSRRSVKRSTSRVRPGFVAKFGTHTVKSGSALQSSTALTVGQVEFYAVVKGGHVGPSVRPICMGLGIQNES